MGYSRDEDSRCGFSHLLPENLTTRQPDWCIMGVTMDEETQQQVAQMFVDARRLRGETFRQVSEASGVNPSTISLIEKEGISVGLRTLDFLKLAQYYGIDVSTIVSMLGLSSEAVTPDTLEPYMQVIASLGTEDQSWLLGVIDALLRGMRRRS